MNAIFHRAKHWQLFVLLVGGVILFQLLIMFSMVDVMAEARMSLRPPNMTQFFLISVPMWIFVIFIVFGWEWSVGSGMKHLLPKGVKMNHKLYRAFTIVPIAYLLVYMIFMMLWFSKMEQIAVAPNPIDAISTIFSMMIGMIILLPVGMFATFCIFYNYYYCAKTLKSIELGYEAELNDYIGYFFLFWFNFIGFWIIQPSVNRITSEGWVPPTPPPGYEPIGGPNSPFDPIPEKEVHPRGELLKTKNHEAFDHDDDFEGLF